MKVNKNISCYRLCTGEQVCLPNGNAFKEHRTTYTSFIVREIPGYLFEALHRELCVKRWFEERRVDIEAISTQYRNAFDIVSILTRRSRTEYLNSIETLSMSRRYCFDIYVHTCRRLCGLVPFASFYVQNGSARYDTEAYKERSYKARTTTHRKKSALEPTLWPAPAL